MLKNIEPFSRYFQKQMRDDIYLAPWTWILLKPTIEIDIFWTIFHLVTWSTQRSTIRCLEFLLHCCKPKSRPLQPPSSLLFSPPPTGLRWTEGRTTLSFDANRSAQWRPAKELLRRREPPGEKEVTSIEATQVLLSHPCGHLPLH